MKLSKAQIKKTYLLPIYSVGNFLSSRRTKVKFEVRMVSERSKVRVRHIHTVCIFNSQV